MEEQEQEGNVKEFIGLLQQYIGKRLHLMKLEGSEAIIRIFSLLIVYLVLALILFLILMMLSVVGGLFFAKMFNSNLGGFAVVVGVYLVLFVIIYSSRKYLVEKVFAPQFLKMIFNDEDEENEDS